ncbi:glutamate--cysteine ligase [Candidatus Woesearchaeota archaeon]|nr:glutamate--cysteine ligase [Candidatus Woesearchaeota archaeon]
MIQELQNLINTRRKEIISWVEEERSKVPMPVYSSFDIRDNGTKASIVDSNLFPAGFNNLSWESSKLASEYFKRFLPTLCKSKNILIVPEAHTRNLFYLSNLNSLKKILEDADYKVALGSVREDIEDILKVKDSNNKILTLEKMKNVNGKLTTKSFDCGMVLLNNDFSMETPDLLKDVHECIAPPIKLGWLHRKKSHHFNHFCKLINEFSKKMDIDDWLLCPRTHEVDDIDFMTGKNVEKIAEAADKIIWESNEKYKKYKIKGKPHVFVKDNSGTYGMGVFSAYSGKEILELNSKQRRKMKSGKEKNPISSVIIQDGISTRFNVKSHAAEPVIYSVAGKVVGGFMRIHDSKDQEQSLNAPGAKFDVLLKDNITKPIIDFIGDNTQISLYSLLANMANIAIGKEMEDAK